METILSKENMDSVKALADVNLKISEAKNVLFRLQEKETEYLIEREKKAVERIEQATKRSKELFIETQENYEAVQKFHASVLTFADFLSEIHEKSQKMLEDFNTRAEIWEQTAADQEKKIEILRKDIKNDRVRIDNDKKSIDQKNEILKKEKARIESRQAQIKSALLVLNKKKNG